MSLVMFTRYVLPHSILVLSTNESFRLKTFSLPFYKTGNISINQSYLLCSWHKLPTLINPHGRQMLKKLQVEGVWGKGDFRLEFVKGMVRMIKIFQKHKTRVPFVLYIGSLGSVFNVNTS